MTEHDFEQEFERVEPSCQVDVDVVELVPVEFFGGLPHANEAHVGQDEQDGGRRHSHQGGPLAGVGQSVGHHPGQDAGDHGQVEDDDEQQDRVLQRRLDHPVTSEDFHLFSQFAQQKAEMRK